MQNDGVSKDKTLFNLLSQNQTRIVSHKAIWRRALVWLVTYAARTGSMAVARKNPKSEFRYSKQIRMTGKSKQRSPAVGSAIDRGILNSADRSRHRGHRVRTRVHR